MTKRKSTKGQTAITKHTYRTKDRVTRNPLKTGGRLRCSGRISSFCSTSDTHDHRLHRITYIQNASVSIMLPYSSGIFNFAYTSTREELIVIFQLKTCQQIRRYLSVLLLWYCLVSESKLLSCVEPDKGHPLFTRFKTCQSLLINYFHLKSGVN